MSKTTSYFNFTKGKAAQFLKQRRNLKFKGINNVEIQEIEDISISNIDIRDGYHFFNDGETEYLAFYFKESYYMYWKSNKLMKKLSNPKFPKFHTIVCETRLEYSGFVFSTSMPVNVYDKSFHENHENCYLKLCGNCKSGIWNNFDDIILSYIEEHDNLSYQGKGSYKGYLRLWPQVSRAYRESKEWRCEECSVELISKENRMHLHVHHVNSNIRDNRRDNFQSLCVLCHYLKHPKKIKGIVIYELEEFISEFQQNLSPLKIKQFEDLIS